MDRVIGEPTMTPAEEYVWERWARQGQLGKYLQMGLPRYQRALETAAAKA